MDKKKGKKQREEEINWEVQKRKGSKVLKGRKGRLRKNKTKQRTLRKS